MMYCTYPCLLHDAHVMVPTTALPALAEQERLAAFGEVATQHGLVLPDPEQERLAAIGAAVERLGTDYTVNARRGYVTVRTYRFDSMHVEHFGQADTLPAAVNAALEDKP